MDPSAKRLVGRTGVAVSQLGLGGASYAELFYKVPEQDAFGAIQAAWDGGIRYFDTAPWYGRGLSELRTGAGLRDHPRSEYVLSTKIGRWLKASQDPDYDGTPWLGGTPFEVVFDYSYDGIMRAYEQSQLRLGLARYDLAVIHDLDHMYHGTGVKYEGYLIQLATSGWRAVTELKASGLHPGCRRGCQRDGHDPATPGYRRSRLLPHRDAVHAAAAGGPASGVPGLCQAGHRVHHRRAVSVGHPGDRSPRGC